MQLLSYPTPDSSRSLFCVLFGMFFVEDDFDDDFDDYFSEDDQV